MEYGELELQEGAKLLLFGVPGQKHFQFIWPIVAKGALGAVLLLDASRTDWADDFQFFVQKFFDLANNGALVVGFNRAFDEYAIEEKMAELCLALDMAIPFYFADPRSQADVSELLQTLVVNAQLHAATYEHEQETNGDQP
jgi:signal recognition particle receptor subunit beta